MYLANRLIFILAVKGLHLFTWIFAGHTKKSRLKQLIEWCGGEAFDGCLVFDECHKAKNFVPGNESASSKVALSVCSIQE